MSSLFHRAFGRALSSSSLHARPLACSSIPSVILPRSSQLSTRIQKPQTQLRFFTSTPKPRAQPYPHRQHHNPYKPPFLGFLDRIPHNSIFWGIITINGVVFTMWILSRERAKSEGVRGPYLWMFNNFTTSWRNFSQGRMWTPITAAFSHENFGHILFNGFTFFFMARPVLELLGGRHFLFLYLGGGLISSIASMGWNNLVKNRDINAYGASGAIYSVISLMACIAPKATFQLYGIIPIPAWLCVTGIFAYDTYSAMYDKQKGTDTAGHVGGLLAGMGYFLARRFRLF